VRKLAVLVVIVAGALVFAFAAIGSSSGSSSSSGGAAAAAKPNGKSLFKKNCAACHTLKAAGATGKVGPNLDSLAPSKSEVATQVRNGGGSMPAFKGRLSKAQINAIAAYVANNT
jgi:mono/diheme cytochrome c family protein